MLTPRRIDELHAFRSAARQIRDSSAIDQGRTVHIGFRMTLGEEAEQTAQLLENEPFRSLALAIRLIYQTGEPANFGHICNILYPAADAIVRTRVSELRKRYNDTLAEPYLTLSVDIDGSRRTFTPGEVFETWMYGGVFHQDPDRQAAFSALSSLSHAFAFAVQSVALLLAGRIIDLDDIVADHLGEERVPRIG